MTTSSNRLLLLNIGSPSRLLSISPKGGDIQILVADLGVAPGGIALDPIRRHIFWTYMGASHEGEDFFVNDGSIERVDFDGENRKTIVPRGKTFTPRQIHCDAERGFIYWCDREGMRVMRARVDGTEVTVLIQTGSTEDDRHDRRRHCVGVAIDSVGGFLYWTQKGKPDGNEGRILRAPLELPMGVDPANRTDIEVLFDDLPPPIELEWVEETCHLYWTDRGVPPAGNTFNRADIRLGEPITHEVLLTGLREGIGLAIDCENERAFVSDLGGFVHMLNLYRPNAGKTIFCGHGPLTGIAYAGA